MQDRCTYLLPYRRSIFRPEEARELREYFRLLRECGCEVIVVDGSPDEVFAQDDRAWKGACRHERVDRRFGYLNDKVNGIHTGLELSRHEKIILADDDVRYSQERVRCILKKLDQAQVARPQNYLSPLPWWARMEAARMLINRATLRAGDYPGTCAFRRSTMRRVGHYDGDVLFDNEEIVRHFAREGATIDYAIDLFIEKRPPTFRKWMEQRPRQAYEDFPLRLKTAAFFSLPVLFLLIAVFLGTARLMLCVSVLGLIAVVVAAAGRARGRANEFFPRQTILWAPLWVLERSLSTYWAFYWFLTRGGYPFGGTVLTRGVGRDWFEGGRVAAENARNAVR